MNVFSQAKDIRLMEYINKKSLVKRTIEFIIGCFLIALAYNIFVVPNNLVPGNVGGLAVIFNRLFIILNSIVILILNIFLLILSYILLGKEKTKATILGSLLLPVFVSLTENINIWLQIDTSQVLLSSIFGGIIYGFGAGIVFKAGFTTGGTDIINQIICKYGKTSMGKSMLMSDGLIVLLSGVVFGINNMMYSILMLYIISLMADRVVLGVSESKMFMIVTDKEEEVRKFILKELGQKITVFNAHGGYKKKLENVIMTVLPTKDYYLLKEGIKTIDENAFYIITDSYEVFGGKDNDE